MTKWNLMQEAMQALQVITAAPFHGRSHLPGLTKERAQPGAECSLLGLKLPLALVRAFTTTWRTSNNTSWAQQYTEPKSLIRCMQNPLFTTVSIPSAALGYTGDANSPSTPAFSSAQSWASRRIPACWFRLCEVKMQFWCWHTAQRLIDPQ